jgi:osmoprotectant transport system ATP-binding protein
MLMDEPFSAVDPVVRAELQNEFLRLQSELDKTILFVTHDIDEAVKLGDEVGVMRVGGKLAQLATPAELLAAPVDDFVAGFVGRDRGYRSLGFRAAGDLPLVKEPTVRSAPTRPRPPGRPGTAGCSRSTATGARRAGSTCASSPGRDRRTGAAAPRRHRGQGGRLAAGRSRRRAVGAVRRGVIADGEGRLLGTITAREVVERIEAQRTADEAREPEPAAGGRE